MGNEILLNKQPNLLECPTRNAVLFNKKTTKWSDFTRLQLPVSNDFSGSTYTISSDEEKGNSKFDTMRYALQKEGIVNKNGEIIANGKGEVVVPTDDPLFLKKSQ